MLQFNLPFAHRLNCQPVKLYYYFGPLWDPTGSAEAKAEYFIAIIIL